MHITTGLHQGDCLDLMKQIPNHSVDMVLCDLPYGTTQNRWDSVIPTDRLWAAYARICKPTAAIVLTASQPFTSVLVASNLKMFKHEWIWIKNRGSNFANTVREPMKEHESVLVFSKGKWTYNKQMQERTGGGAKLVGKSVNHGKGTDNYAEFETASYQRVIPELRVPSSWQKFNCEVGLHPTQKPVALFEYLIRTYSNEGDTVLDNCVGSGTTAIAAMNLNRNWIAFEQDPTYHGVAKARIDRHAEELETKRIFGI